MVCLAEIPDDSVLVGFPGDGGLDQRDQCVGPHGKTLIEGEVGVVVVQAAVADSTELDSDGARFQDTMIRDKVLGSCPLLELILR